MTDEQAIRLRCLELAVEAANREGKHWCLETIAKYQDWFYNRIVTGIPTKAPEAPKGRRTQKDKLADPFA